MPKYASLLTFTDFDGDRTDKSPSYAVIGAVLMTVLHIEVKFVSTLLAWLGECFPFILLLLYLLRY